MSVLEVFTLLGGIGLFLFGMTMMSTGLRNACGERLRRLLERTTKNKLKAVLSGTAVTVLIQSSSATDVMVIGFVTSGLMTLSQAIGVIMGANIGTTVTAQITAFDIGSYAPFILFVGTVMYLFVKQKTVRHIGSVIMGFGMLFLGISLMKSTISPLTQTEAFMVFLQGVSNPVVAVLFGILFAALLQSSSSAIVILQAFAVQGIITYDAAVYMIIGAALGSVAPNLLAGITANRNGRRCAILNLIFNIIRAAVILVAISVIPQILDIIRSLSPGNIARQIANTHTIFAVVSVAVLLPFSGLIVKLTERIIPVRDEEKRMADARRLVYLTQTDKVPTAVALEQAHREIARMGDISFGNLMTAVDCFFTPNDDAIALVEETEEVVNYLEQTIITKLVELSLTDMSPRDKKRLYNMLLTVSDIERISDHAENIIEYASMRMNSKAKMTTMAIDDLRTLSDASINLIGMCLDIFRSGSADGLDEAERLEDRVDRIQERIVQNHISRLMNEQRDPSGGVIFTDMSIDLERCADHAINIAEALAKDAA